MIGPAAFEVTAPQGHAEERAVCMRKQAIDVLQQPDDVPRSYCSPTGVLERDRTSELFSSAQVKERYFADGSSQFVISKAAGASAETSITLDRSGRVTGYESGGVRHQFDVALQNKMRGELAQAALQPIKIVDSSSGGGVLAESKSPEKARVYDLGGGLTAHEGENSRIVYRMPDDGPVLVENKQSKVESIVRPGAYFFRF